MYLYIARNCSKFSKYFGQCVSEPSILLRFSGTGGWMMKRTQVLTINDNKWRCQIFVQERERGVDHLTAYGLDEVVFTAVFSRKGVQYFQHGSFSCSVMGMRSVCKSEPLSIFTLKSLLAKYLITYCRAIRSW